MKKIGNVVIDDTYDSGLEEESEAYLDKLLDIVKKYDEVDYNRIITAEKSWDLLFHLSHIRENIVAGLPITKRDEVLEIGADCGAITGALARKANSVDALELSMKKTLINAYRHKDYTNIRLMTGDFQAIEDHLEKRYNYIVLIGTFAFIKNYWKSSNPHLDFLRMLQKHLLPGGKVVIAIENKYGLKYWAGCREEHTGKMFEGIEGYRIQSNILTFGRNEMIEMVREAGYKEVKFYYPYPDYNFPIDIFSDDYLPSEGQLFNNMRNYDQSRFVIFNEGLVYDNIIKDNMYPLFSNSFLVICGGEA